MALVGHQSNLRFDGCPDWIKLPYLLICYKPLLVKIEPEAVYAFKRFWALLLGLFGKFILIPDLSIFE